MNGVMITLSRSDALAECGKWEKGEPSVTIGPFSYVELTYEWLRVGPNGDFIGRFEGGYWYLDSDTEPFSDVAIGADSQDLFDEWGIRREGATA